jgi:hypothetical protein
MPSSSTDPLRTWQGLAAILVPVRNELRLKEKCHILTDDGKLLGEANKMHLRAEA